MATVRISGELKDHVRRHIEGMFAKRYDKLNEESSGNELGMRCYRAMIPADERHLAESLHRQNDKWLKTQSAFWVHLNYVNGNGKVDRRRFTINLNPPQPVPYDTSHGTTVFEHTPVGQELLPLARKFDALDKEKNDLIRSLVDGVLDKCSTLGQVLKVWPNALDYMPEATRAKHYEASSGRKNPAEEIVIDETIKATLFKAQLMQ